MRSMVQSRAIRPSGGQLDILESLGLIHTQKVYEQRVKALATPGVYNRERKVEWDRLTDAVKKTYEDTVADVELVASGIPITQRQELAINAAKMKYATQNAILEANFPSGSQTIAMESFAQQGFPKAAMQAAPRRASRRKATTRKRK